MRKNPLIHLSLLAALLTSCGGEMVNARMSTQEMEAIAKKVMVDKQVELEKTLELNKDLDLKALAFSEVAASETEKSLSAYMSENNLTTALLVFCNEDNAACRMVTRDLSKDPIAGNAKSFSVIGVLVEKAEHPEELPSYVKFDDHQNGFLDKELMESPESDVVPYFALVYSGKSKAGIVARWALDKVTHAELKSNVEAFLSKLGVQP